MYAIIQDSGTQIKVSEGDVIRVAIRDLPADAATVKFEQVLLVSGQGGLKVGAPMVAGATVTADILEQGRTPRVMSYRYKKRKQMRRKRGHRQDYLKVKITAIAC